MNDSFKSKFRIVGHFLKCFQAIIQIELKTPPKKTDLETLTGGSINMN